MLDFYEPTLKWPHVGAEKCSSALRVFADDTVVCSEGKEQVEDSRKRYPLERGGTKVSRNKTSGILVSEERVKTQRVELVFKYVGSTLHSNGRCGGESVQDSSETCCDVRFGDGATAHETRGRVEDAEIFPGDDQDGED